MENKKTVAEELREHVRTATGCGALAKIAKVSCDEVSCYTCTTKALESIADAIEAEEAERQLPDGIQWPRFEDGELVKFGDEYASGDTIVTVGGFIFDRSGFSIYVSSSGTGEREYGEPVKRRKHDTWEQLSDDAEEFVNSLGDGRNATYVFTLLERQRKLMGGE